MKANEFKRNTLIYSAVIVVIFALITWPLNDCNFKLALSLQPIGFYYKLTPLVLMIIFYTVASMLKSKGLSILVYTLYLSTVGLDLFALINSLILAKFLLALIYLILAVTLFSVNFIYIQGNNQIINDIVSNHGGHFKTWRQSIYRNVITNKHLVIALVIYYIANSILNNPK